MQDDISLLEIMLRDQEKRQDIYSPGPYWLRYANRTSKAIREDGLKNFRANSRIVKGYGDAVLINPFDLSPLETVRQQLLKKIIDFPPFNARFVSPFLNQTRWHYRQTQKYRDLYYNEILGSWFETFVQRFPLPETLHGNPQFTVTLRDMRIGRNYLDAFLRLHNYSQWIDFHQVESVFEIGGGYGAWAHTLLHCFPNIKKYIYLDIPPVIYVGTQYLKHFYPESVRTYRETQNQKVIRFENNGTPREIIVICPWQIEHLEGEVDLFFNSASFQEMPRNVVKNYVSHLARLLHGESKLGLYVYQEGNPEKTIPPNELVELVAQEAGSQLMEKIPDLEINTCHYFLASRTD